MSTEFRGSCNCQSVTFVCKALPKVTLNCHCQLCRKMNGSAFSSYVVFANTDVELVSGNLKTVQVSDNATKSVCSECGTPIFNRNPKHAGLTIVYLGAIDDLDHVKPMFDTYCESRLDWIGHLATQHQLPQGIS